MTEVAENEKDVVQDVATNEADSTVETTKVEEVTEEKHKNAVLEYLGNIWYGIVDSFRYNPCKLPGILVALPGLFIGFFLGFHSSVDFFVNTQAGEQDISGLLMFILVLMGCVNIANGVTLSSKKNLGTVITSSVCSLIIVICGVLWIQRIFYSQYLVNSGILTTLGGSNYDFNFSTWMSVISVILSIVCSVAGCLLGYLKRNKNYKKVVY